MYSQRKQAKEYLNNSSLTDFWHIVREAKITSDNQRILDARFVEGKSITAIAIQEHCSEEKVSKVIRQSYDKIYGLIGGDYNGNKLW